MTTINNNNKSKKSAINFLSLYKVFRLRVIKHFILTIIVTFLYVLLEKNFQTLLSLRGGNYTEQIGSSCCSGGGSSHKSNSPMEMIEINEKTDYWNIMLYGNEIKKALNLRHLTKIGFIRLFLIISVIFSVLKYFDNYFEQEISYLSSLSIKNKLLDKFRSLDFESKNKKRDDIKFLAEFEVEKVSSMWEHLLNHTFHSFFTIILIIVVNIDDIKKINERSSSSLIFIFIWMFLFNFSYFYLLDVSNSYEDSHKEDFAKEIGVIDREISKSLLIESMGLNSYYSSLQKGVSKINTSLKVFPNIINSLNISIGYLLTETLVYLSMLIENDIKDAIHVCFVVYIISNQIKEIFTCSKEYKLYQSSLARINDFLALPQKDENLEKQSVNPEEIDEIVFSDVSFRYANSDNFVLEDCNRVFSRFDVNKITGKNGTGKSTILYLTLGLLKPNSGKILIKMRDGSLFDINCDINLKNWRESVVAYCSHENLIEEGSTGQRQIKNIEEVLENRKSAKIFIFDEASNALDDDKQQFLTNKIDELVKLGKIVMFVKH